METVFKNTLFTVVIATTGTLISMQPIPVAQPASQVITRISNNLETQKVIVTFDTQALHSISVKAKKDFLFAKMGERAPNDTYELIAQYKGFPISRILARMHVCTPLGVATIIGAGNEATCSTVIQFDPFSGNPTILDSSAKQLRIIIDSTGHVSLVDDDPKPATAP